MSKSVKKLSMSTFATMAVLSLVPTILKGEIISLKSMHDVRQKIEKILENTEAKDIFAAFDIDMTLIQSTHPATYLPHRLKYIKEHKTIATTLPDDKKELLEILAINYAPNVLIEKDAPQILSKLKEKGIPVIAFTASLTGKIENHSRFEEQRLRELQDLGMNFTSSFNGYEDIRLTGFEAYRGNYPVFHQGILYANGAKGPRNKGSILVAFLNQIKIAPKVIIMVDDKRKNLDDIEESLKNYNSEIQFIGIEYQGAFDYAPEDIDAEGFKDFWQKLAEKAQQAS